jgi:hypothetical protein
MLLHVTIEARPYDGPSGPALSHFLNAANFFIHKHFWLAVNFPTIAPATPRSSLLKVWQRFTGKWAISMERYFSGEIWTARWDDSY